MKTEIYLFIIILYICIYIYKYIYNGFQIEEEDLTLSIKIVKFEYFLLKIQW